MDESELPLEFQKISQFNMSIASLQRIHLLLQAANTSYISGDLLIYWRVVQCLDKETDAYMIENEREEAIVKFSKYIKNINIVKGTIIYNQKDLDILDQFERWVRRKLLEKGLLMAKGDNPYNALKG